MRPVLFELGPFRLYGYGALIVLGGILSLAFLKRRGEKAGLKSADDFWILVNVILGSGFVGGRLLFVFEYTRPFSRNFWETLVSPSQGFSVIGAMLGVPAAVAVFCRLRKIPVGRLYDNLAVVAPFWHVFGRLGCFMAGCCHGRPADLPWAVTFSDPRSMVRTEWLGVPLHPTQLYEAAGNGLIALGLFFLLKRTENSKPGLVTAAYFAASGAMRFVDEYYRGDTVPFALGLTAAQALGLGLIGASAAYLGWRTACSRPS